MAAKLKCDLNAARHSMNIICTCPHSQKPRFVAWLFLQLFFRNFARKERPTQTKHILHEPLRNASTKLWFAIIVFAISISLPTCPLRRYWSHCKASALQCKFFQVFCLSCQLDFWTELIRRAGRTGGGRTRCVTTNGYDSCTQVSSVVAKNRNRFPLFWPSALYLMRALALSMLSWYHLTQTQMPAKGNHSRIHSREFS